MIEVRVGATAVPRGVEVVDDTDADAGALRHAGGTLARGLRPGRTVLGRPGLAGDRLAAFVEGLVLGDYSYTRRSGPKPRNRVVELAGVGDAAAVQRGLVAAGGTAWARDLANTASDVKTPAWLGAQAMSELGPLGVDVAVHDERWLAEHGFGGVLAVGGASHAGPRLIEASWRPRGSARRPHLVLVGKGITFDTGGLNIKLGDGMRTMRTDMSGGAAVLGALRILAMRRVHVRVTALVPAAENAVGGAAYRPGDVVRHVGGRTSEIQNTDAEGRVVLADALAHAVARLRPDVLVDIATLTGAMKIALGLRTAGLFATTDELARGLCEAGAATGEPVWRMPLVADYESSLRSEIADANNSPGNPGGITAALYLRHFTGGLPWAHLDIAGPGRAAKDDGMFSVGATGFGARLLAHWAATHG